MQKKTEKNLKRKRYPQRQEIQQRYDWGMHRSAENEKHMPALCRLDDDEGTDTSVLHLRQRGWPSFDDDSGTAAQQWGEISRWIANDWKDILPMWRRMQIRIVAATNGKWKFLPHDAMHKRGLCPVSVCLSVSPSRCCIVSRRMKISSNFFPGPVAPWFWFFFTPCADTQFQGESRQLGRKIHGVLKFCDFSLKSPFTSSQLFFCDELTGVYRTFVTSWRQIARDRTLVV